MKKHKKIYNYLTHLYINAPVFKLTDKSKLLILSDFHLGSRKSRDDFLKNSKLCMDIIDDYFNRDYTLILNGDIEELQRISLTTIQKKWHDLYSLFKKFQDKNKLFKIIGNHDADLIYFHYNSIINKIYESIIFTYKNNQILIFHGHQSSRYIKSLSGITRLILRYIANPLHIGNISRTYENKRSYKTEKRIYYFSKMKKIISIIAHTHRPLFESLSEIDILKFKIEHLLRIYPEVNRNDQKKIIHSLRLYNEELKILHEENRNNKIKGSLYNQDIILPFIFNSGCVIGKRGINGIEIEKGIISLVQWFTKEQKDKFFKYNEAAAKHIIGTNYYRMTLRSDQLDYIFNRINFLS